MTPTAKRWSATRWLTVLGAAAALTVMVLAVRGRRPLPPPAAEAVDTDAPSAPYHQRRRFPNLVEDARTPAPAVATARPPEAPPSPATAPAPAPAGSPIVEDHPPPAPPQTGSQWITGYRDAVCGCKTRGCVRDLQGRFLHTLGTVSYATERDQDLYAEASRAAIACYAALPEDS